MKITPKGIGWLIFGVLVCASATESTFEAFIVWVAPNSLATASFSSLISQAMILLQGESLAAIIALRPTAPQPVISIEVSAAGRRTFRTVPAPVWIPQPIGAAR